MHWVIGIFGNSSFKCLIEKTLRVSKTLQNVKEATWLGQIFSLSFKSNKNS